MSILDKLLEGTGLKYEELTPDEKNTINGWIESLDKSTLSIEKIKDYINEMKSAVENELARSSLGRKKDLFLKARLRNYMLLDALLSTPEKARQQIENMIGGMVKKVK